MKKLILLFAFFLGSMTAANSETQNFPLFNMEIPQDWTHSIADSTSTSGKQDGQITIYSPDGVSEVNMLTIAAPVEVDNTILRTLTNIDSSIQLDWQNWKNFSGYQYSYTERDVFYKQWWIANMQTILFVTYASNREMDASENRKMDELINSINFF